MKAKKMRNFYHERAVYVVTDGWAEVCLAPNGVFVLMIKLCLQDVKSGNTLKVCIMSREFGDFHEAMQHLSALLCTLQPPDLAAMASAATN